MTKRRYLALSKGIVSLILMTSLFAQESAPAGKDAMREAMHTYFDQEKTAALIGIGGSVVAGGTGAYLVTQGDLSRGIGFSLIGVGVIGLAVGGTVYLRTGSQVEKLDKQLDADPATYKKKEGPRMERVNAQFKYLKIAEISLFVGGTTATVIGVARGADLTTGFGIGLMIDAVLLFFFDYFAEARAHVYAQQIIDFTAAQKNELIQGLSFSYAF